MLALAMADYKIKGQEEAVELSAVSGTLSHNSNRSSPWVLDKDEADDFLRVEGQVDRIPLPDKPIHLSHKYKQGHYLVSEQEVIKLQVRLQDRDKRHRAALLD